MDWLIYGLNANYSVASGDLSTLLASLSTPPHK
jgi:hypothetical protein